MTKASIQAVAREAGVSTSTVSRAFAKPDLVLPETRERVMAAARKLDYRVSRSAAALKSGQSFRVALLMSGGVTWFNASVYAGLGSVLRPAGYDIAVFPMSSAADRRSFFEDLPVRRNADAVIVGSFDIDPGEVARLKRMAVPIVGVNIPSPAGFDAGVSIDDRAAERAAAEHLVTLGHRRIAFVGYGGDEAGADPHALRFSATARLRGVLDACAAHAAQGVEATVLNLPADRDRDRANAAVELILSAMPVPTAVCVCEDGLAVPTLLRLRQYGREVPGDLSLVGFDDNPYAAPVGLTTVHQDPFAMGAAAARKTLALIAGEPLGEGTPAGLAFETPAAPLVLRETTAPLNRAG
ncbi:LacI family DNA-binding transcriptional regulator [Bifidobacterium pullorum subsp. saeculare]|uniref:LacI family DNA-binding transcriptional regulator n=1 Tax=Bifidobacterium pullorum subsp. saeculare TaxID=78257 RepID=A0A938X0K3_9BIFI|nr:LacI family DNA-binding transcriptional regulator [Bifidobacterium pullorum]MBM6700062.1 LacI family DNA-binding transcriptional regulator [Bifidobacterium pullorum subsp. saeculare]